MKKSSAAQPMPERLARPAEVVSRYRISEPTLWRWCKERQGFPKPRKIGPNTTVFSLDELDAYFAAQSAQRA